MAMMRKWLADDVVAPLSADSSATWRRLRGVAVPSAETLRLILRRAFP
jgi:hypothetical protein